METATMRTRIIKYIEQADERMLRIINAIIEAEKPSMPASPESSRTSSPGNLPKETDDEKSREEGIGSLKDDHRLK